MMRSKFKKEEHRNYIKTQNTQKKKNQMEETISVLFEFSVLSVFFSVASVFLSSDFYTQPFNPPCVKPPTTRSWKIAISTATGTMVTINAAEMMGQGKVNSP